MERTVVMDKSKGEPVISVKTTSRSKERVRTASAFLVCCGLVPLGLTLGNGLFPFKLPKPL